MEALTSRASMKGHRFKGFVAFACTDLLSYNYVAMTL
jgi:hypothetical protein